MNHLTYKEEMPDVMDTSEATSSWSTVTSSRTQPARKTTFRSGLGRGTSTLHKSRTSRASVWGGRTDLSFGRGGGADTDPMDLPQINSAGPAGTLNSNGSAAHSPLSSTVSSLALAAEAGRATKETLEVDSLRKEMIDMREAQASTNAENKETSNAMVGALVTLQETLRHLVAQNASMSQALQRQEAIVPASSTSLIVPEMSAQSIVSSAMVVSSPPRKKHYYTPALLPHTPPHQHGNNRQAGSKKKLKPSHSPGSNRYAELTVDESSAEEIKDERKIAALEDRDTARLERLRPNREVEETTEQVKNMHLKQAPTLEATRGAKYNV